MNMIKTLPQTLPGDMRIGQECGWSAHHFLSMTTRCNAQNGISMASQLCQLSNGIKPNVVTKPSTHFCSQHIYIDWFLEVS